MTTQILARAEKAAKMLDMGTAEFLRLVDEGILPPPGPLGRWRVEDLKRIGEGHAARYGRLEL